MDGHECSEVLLSELDSSKRIDAEYYSKQYIAETNQLLSKPHFVISDYYKVTDGEHGSVEYLDSGVKYLTAENIKQGYVDLTKIRYVSEEVNKKNARASVKEGDILISIKGTLGAIAIADKHLSPCNMNRDVAIIKSINAPENYNYLITLFLMGKFGSLQSQRGGSGGVQQMITLGRLREFIIPTLGDSLCLTLKSAYDNMLSLLKESENIYDEAENYLEREIGIDMSFISNGGIAIKSFKDSFENTGRLDAEYYQPKYDDFENHVLNYKNGYTTPRKEFLLIKDKCLKDQPEYPYVEIGDINIGNGDAEYNIIQTEELPANAKIMTQKGDLLVSTVRPYRGAVSILDYDNLLVSSAFTVLRENGNFPAQTLQVLLRTKLYKDWLLKFNVGTSYPVIKDEDVLDIPIPILEQKTHEKIKEFVVSSHDALNRAKELLECSKLAVEMAIEHDESTAISWLEAKITSLTT